MSPMDLKVELERINYDGQRIGKRGAVKPQKRRSGTATATMAEMEQTEEMPPVPPIDHDQSEESVKTLEDTDKMRAISVFTPFPICELLAAASTVDDSMVTTIVFELEHVFCTNIEGLHHKLEGHVSTMTDIQKQLCFGGADRIQSIQRFLERIRIQNEASNEELRCYVVSDESSKMILQLLRDTDLLKPFVSLNRRNRNKLVSHIIGWDHPITRGCHC